MSTPADAVSDEPLPIRLTSTIRAGGDDIRDDLRTTEALDEWLDAVGIDRAGTHATERELAQARALRDALRRLAGYVTRDTRPAAASAMTDVAAALDLVNATAAELSRSPPRLAWTAASNQARTRGRRRWQPGSRGSPSRR